MTFYLFHEQRLSKVHAMLQTIVYYLGIYVLLIYLYDNLISPVQIFIGVFKKLLGYTAPQQLSKKYGQWAVITGATDGIGKAYALELARHGLNIVLISRNQSKLYDVAEEIVRHFTVKVQTIEADFAKGPEIFAHIENELEDKQIGILVNNVGQSYPGVLSSLESSQIWSVLYTNVAAVTQLSHMILRHMQKSAIRGAIINISSGTELQPTPYIALYAASKAFTRSLTISLQAEARPYGITVQLVSPGFVRTKINKYFDVIMRGGLFIPEPHVFARWALSTLGLTDQTTGYFWHGLQAAVIKLFPWRLRAFGAKILFQLLYGRNFEALCRKQ